MAILVLQPLGSSTTIANNFHPSAMIFLGQDANIVGLKLLECALSGLNVQVFSSLVNFRKFGGNMRMLAEARS